MRICGDRPQEDLRGQAPRGFITQGETASYFWPNLKVEIDFAYRTFKWSNEARGNAGVHCVIIGFSAFGSCDKTIFDGEVAHHVKRINAYLVDAPDILVQSRSTPLCDVPAMVYGNKPTDGGNLIFTPEERDAFLSAEPQAAPFVKQLLGSEEFINGKMRYCLWLVGASPVLLKDCPLVRERIEKVRQMRLSSKAAATRAYAPMGGLFRQITQPEGKNYIIVPCVSSEKRDYVPIGFMKAETKVTNAVLMIPDATLYHFGVLTSRMHNAWMRAVCGRLESRYRYSKDVVYNNFIWPSPTDGLKAKIEETAQDVINIRKSYFVADSNCSLAMLYDPLTMPPELVKAHAKLDALVDKAYGRAFANDAERVAHLFKLYALRVK